MRRYPRPDHQEIRLGNVLPEISGEIDTRTRVRLTPRVAPLRSRWSE